MAILRCVSPSRNLPPLEIEWVITLLEPVLSHTLHTMGQICHLPQLVQAYTLLVDEAEKENVVHKNMSIIRDLKERET